MVEEGDGLKMRTGIRLKRGSGGRRKVMGGGLKKGAREKRDGGVKKRMGGHRGRMNEEYRMRKASTEDGKRERSGFS